MFRYDLFVSYSSRYTPEAMYIQEQAERRGLKVFVAAISLKPGDEWADEIRQALIDSRELCVLVTPESVESEWVITEWSAAWLLTKRITPILLEYNLLGKLSPRLLKYQVGFYHRVDDFLDKVVERKNEVALQEAQQAIYDEYRSHKLVQETLFSQAIKGSPFVFTELMKVTRKRIFVSGQNLYTLLVTYQDENEEMIFEFLSRDEKRQVQIMVCDPGYKYAVEAWKVMSSAGDKYERDLLESISILQKWLEEAKEKNLNLEAKMTPAVPISMTFVDPESKEGRLVFTPNVFEEHPGFRPSYLLLRELHEQTFMTYWENYYQTYLRATPIGKLE